MGRLKRRGDLFCRTKLTMSIVCVASTLARLKSSSVSTTYRFLSYIHILYDLIPRDFFPALPVVAFKTDRLHVTPVNR